MNRYESWREARNKRFANWAIGIFCTAVAVGVLMTIAWDLGREQGKNIEAAKCQVITQAWTEAHAAVRKEGKRK